MIESYFDQIEFRWQNGYDFSAIASSDGSIKDRWDRLLRDYVGIANVQPDLGLPSNSAVYLVTEKREAAVVLRFDLPAARQVANNVEAGRHRLVARVLIGPAELLTPERALYLAYSSLNELMGPGPGQVDVRDQLPRVPVDGLLRYLDGQGANLAIKARAERRLARLIDARLGAPHDPLKVILPRDQAGQSLYNTPALPLLLGLIKITEPLLGGICSPLGPNESFSTFEPEVQGDGRILPDIIFQPQPHPSAAAVSRYVKVSMLEIPPDGTIGAMLAKAYRELGSGLDLYLRRAASKAPDLPGRLEILRSEPDLRNYWAKRDQYPAATAQPATAQSSRTGPQRVQPGYGLPDPPQPLRPHDRVPASMAAPAAGRLDEDVPDFVDMYFRLAQLRDEPGFRELLALVLAKAGSGHLLSPANAHEVLKQLTRNGWYCDRVAREYKDDAADQLAILLRPVLVGLLRDQRTFPDLRHWEDVPPLAREAMAKARGLMNDEVGGTALEIFLVRLFRTPRPGADPPVATSGAATSGAAERQPPQDEAPSRVYGLPVIRSPKIAAVFMWAALVSTTLIGLQIIWVAL